ncbi:PREDICTED: high mobility group B protein 6 isoform X1 [Brassica oleracea var. oleracea]|uniref:No apical meristem-associated C-terminal domain-containing protein n=1 Tax=Brassica oleracea var. oleracea TaxID=109376 RepID=A0A0D3AZ86_BRAOL|nr:PREDICTED: high mobility group B protein 6 isoform X1 [Brassica oleracea var. oleracea]
MKSSGRKALQPRNIFNVPAADTQLQLKKAKAPPLHDDAKDNPVPVPVVESMDASLAEELDAFKKKLERLREDRERTDKMLEERDGALDLKMSQLLQRGELQKSLEIQVDRLFRLKELHSYSSKILPVRSLRAKEQEKRKSFSFNFQETADEPEADSREIASDLSKEANY